MKRTDLAMEIHGLLSAEESASSLPGVRAETKQRGSIRTTVVQVLDEQGARRMGKARGTYLSMELQDTDAQTRAEAAAQLAGHLGKLLPARGAVTVVGLGNRAVTADSLGARSVDRLLITAHLAAARRRDPAAPEFPRAFAAPDGRDPGGHRVEPSVLLHVPFREEELCLKRRDGGMGPDGAGCRDRRGTCAEPLPRRGPGV